MFLSQANIDIHKEYLRQKKLQYSIFEKSYPQIIGKSGKEIKRISLPKGEREELLFLKGEIIAHEMFFDSFFDNARYPSEMREEYGSAAGFLYSLFENAIKSEGFLLVYRARDGKIGYYAGLDYRDIIFNTTVFLAVDLYEHAYFYDYLFDKKLYLQHALSILNLSKLKL